MIFFVTRFDCMTIGALGAILFYQKNALFLKICFSIYSQIISWLAVILMAFNEYHIASVIDQEIIALLTVILIANLSENKKTLINLENKTFDFLGKISYGLYVYHPLIIFYFSKLLKDVKMNLYLKHLIAYEGVFVITLLTASLSYKFFELPFLKLKDKFSVIISRSDLMENDLNEKDAYK